MSSSHICRIDTRSKQTYGFALILDKANYGLKMIFRPLVLKFENIGGLCRELRVSTPVCSMGFHQEARPCVADPSGCPAGLSAFLREACGICLATLGHFLPGHCLLCFPNKESGWHHLGMTSCLASWWA